MFYNFVLIDVLNGSHLVVETWFTDSNSAFSGLRGLLEVTLLVRNKNILIFGFGSSLYKAYEKGSVKTNIQIHKHTDIQTCRHADMQICRHADMQTCRHADM